MKKRNHVRFNVWCRDDQEGWVLVREGLSAKKAISLATHIFASSNWKTDTQIVPVQGILYTPLQNSNLAITKKNLKAAYDSSFA